ncbi:hypothetical protein IAQ61_000703 [Plenodomus lingam]|uniref:uncharacterized protein n=1 Tax=Leptosphaeria maculans TaxID=5022 RepID=UPI00331C5C04|nr:hypothetical protein IAQ61_000703 [Plenodomus lingam]
MSSHVPLQPFRFLDLPSELRNNIYDLLLCSWDSELEQDPDWLSNLSRRCPSYSATALVRTNKRIQAEASDYMIKRNQFIRITCRGLDVRKLFLADGIPVITTDGGKVSQFKGYVMHMTLSKPASTPSVFDYPDFEILILRSDLPKLCDQLDLETVMEDVNSTTKEHISLRVEIKLNYSLAHFLTPKLQHHLLNPVTSLRGLPNLHILDPVDPTLSQTLTTQAAQPRWTNPTTTLEQIHTAITLGNNHHFNPYTSATTWSSALRTLNRIRHSTSWHPLSQSGGLDFINETANLYFTLHLLHAQFLTLDVPSTPTIPTTPSPPLLTHNATAARHHLALCDAAAARFAQHADATWRPARDQRAKMLFLQARWIRLMGEVQRCDKAVRMLDLALRLAPGERAQRDEVNIKTS